MLSCTEFIDRLYDEDCRRALETRGPVPRDVTEHLGSCAECRHAWAEAGEDLHALPPLLLEPAPPALERRVRVRLAEHFQAQPELDRVRKVTWSAAVGAAAALAAAQSLPPPLAGLGPLALALIGASMAFAGRAVYEALDEARS